MVKTHLRERNARSVFETRSFLLVALVDAVFMDASHISPVEREKHGYRCSFGKILFVVLLMNVIWIVLYLERCTRKHNKIVKLFANFSYSYIKKKLKYYLAKYGNKKKNKNIICIIKNKNIIFIYNYV